MPDKIPNRTMKHVSKITDRTMNHVSKIPDRTMRHMSKIPDRTMRHVSKITDRILLDTCPFVGPLIPLFQTSGDISFGLRSQSGQPYSHFSRGIHDIHSLRFTFGVVYDQHSR